MSKMSFYARNCCFAAALAITPWMLSKSAEADVIVIASTVPGIEVNTLLPSGTKITVPEGASVTLIDFDRQQIKVEAPGWVVPEEAAHRDGVQEGGSLWDMLNRFFGAEAAPKLGATRGGVGKNAEDAVDCSALPEDIAILLRNGCKERALGLWKSLQSQAETSLFLGTSKGTGTVSYRFGETIELQAQANFDAYLNCFHEGSDGTTTRFIPYVGSTPRLNANAMGRLPGSLASGDFFIAAGAPEGSDRIQCFATEYDIAPQFPAVLAGDPVIGKNKLDDVAENIFGKIATRMAQAGINVVVHN